MDFLKDRRIFIGVLVVLILGGVQVATAADSYRSVADWTGLNGHFLTPEGVAVDSSGNVYVVDSYNDRIQKYTSTGNFLTQWGTEGSGDGEFNRPQAVAVDIAGYVYVTDRFNSRVQKFSSDGRFILDWGGDGSGPLKIGKKPGQFDYPSGIATDRSGNVYVSDGNNNRIQKFTSTGTFVSQWGTKGSGNGQFDFPWGIAVDGSGNVYVSDGNNNRVQKFTSTGTFVSQWGTKGSGNGQFNLTAGLAVDRMGNVYVVDCWNNRVQKFTPDGVFITKWDVNSGWARMYDPTGIAVDSAGDVYVAVTTTNRIQKFSASSGPLEMLIAFIDFNHDGRIDLDDVFALIGGG